MVSRHWSATRRWARSHGTVLELLGWNQARLDTALRGLGDTLTNLYTDTGRSPVHAAEALVASRRRAR
jgi:hypothetical protein